MKIGGEGGGGGVHSSGPVGGGGCAFSYEQWGDSFIWGESQLGISRGEPIANFLPNWQAQGPSL